MSGTGPRVVYDCNVLLQAFLGRGPSLVCMELAEGGRVRLFASDETIAELRDVLSRPKLWIKHRRITSGRVADFMSRLHGCANVVDNVPHVTSFTRDVDDSRTWIWRLPFVRTA